MDVHAHTHTQNHTGHRGSAPQSSSCCRPDGRCLETRGRGSTRGSSAEATGSLPAHLFYTTHAGEGAACMALVNDQSTHPLNCALLSLSHAHTGACLPFMNSASHCLKCTHTPAMHMTQVSGEGNPGAAAAAAGGGPEAGKGLTSQERAGFKAALLKVCCCARQCVCESLVDCSHCCV